MLTGGNPNPKKGKRENTRDTTANRRGGVWVVRRGRGESGDKGGVIQKEDVASGKKKKASKGVGDFSHDSRVMGGKKEDQNLHLIQLPKSKKNPKEKKEEGDRALGEEEGAGGVRRKSGVQLPKRGWF